ncbi:EAL domain-containing protein [Pseudoduganella sp. FT26W]|uniref:EAL domain-containing protein n=1 Tax=Duganella aquatilis TaxID=2666082 RepID=A0A844DEA2_9BURK|nr:EAL domain-containing protein [Duganella aquatilis]MRW86084.1 EAL domain-containing protein [Duganella aquatilis]
MDMQIMVVTSVATERAHLEQLLGTMPGHEDTITLRFCARLDELLNDVGTVPDLILLNPRLEGGSRRDAWRALAMRYGGVPLVMLALDGPPALTTRASGFGAVSYVITTDTSRELLRQILHAMIVATRHLHLRAGVPSEGDVVLDAIADAVISTDARGRVRYANPAACRLLCADQGEMLGQPINELMRLHDAKNQTGIEHPVLQVLATGGVVRLAAGCTMVRPHAPNVMIEDATSPIRDASGAVSGVVMVFHDVTSAHELQVRVDHLAWHDFLTGLPNRFAAQRHLDQILVEAGAREVPLAVMYLDLDKFKQVNDTLGHAAGDALLVSVAARLRGCFRLIDLVGRQGGDEFVVLMAPGTGRADAAQAAERIRAAIVQPHQLDDQEVHIGCSIGIALYPEHGRSGDELLRHADTALHSAKNAGRNVCRFFNQDLLTSMVERRQMEEALRHALDNMEFELHYQPKVRLDDGALSGCEALLRWHHPQWGWVHPSRFILCAEESGTIVALGRWVLRQALMQARQWDMAGQSPGAIAVNVSALELAHPGFADHVEEQLDAVGLAPARLQLELTESALMSDMRGAASVLQRLKNLGLTLAIDDFGTGYSSLSYLADLPIDLIKVDRSFVHGIDHAPPRRQTLLRAVLALADNLQLAAVAEGIETPQEADFLNDAGCPLGQGFYYSCAVEASAFRQQFLRPIRA